MAAAAIAALLLIGVSVWITGRFAARPQPDPARPDAPASQTAQGAAGAQKPGQPENRTPASPDPSAAVPPAPVEGTPDRNASGAPVTPTPTPVPTDPAATNPVAGNPTATPPGATASTVPAVPDEAAVRELARIRRSASAQYANGQRDAALKVVSAQLAKNSDDQGLRVLVQQWFRDAAGGVATARVQARKNGAYSVAQTEYGQATRAEERAGQLTRSGRLSEAVRALWQAEDLYLKASRQAESATNASASAAGRPAVESRQRETPANPSSAAGAPGSSSSPTSPTSSSSSGTSEAARPRTEPAAPSTSAPSNANANAEADVRRALREYQSAWERLDEGAVRRVRPAFSGELDGMFREYRLQFGDMQVAVTGQRATVTTQVQHAFRPKVGIGGNRTVRTVFRLEQQRDGRWLITDMDASR